MKVRELLEKLSKLDAEIEIVLSSDGEGNSYSPLADLSEIGVYVSGDYFSSEDLEDEPQEGVPAIVLWPTN